MGEMCTETLEIPTIDFSGPGLKPGTLTWNSCKDRVQQAVEEYGCFKASIDRIPPELLKAILDATIELHALPLEAKRNKTFKRPYCGYYEPSSSAPLFSGLCIEDATIPESIECFTKELWPEGNASISKTILSYSQKLSELDQIIRRMVLESLGVAQYADEMLESTDYLVFANKYEAPNVEEAVAGSVPHTDKCFMTIIYQNQVGGLEIQTKEGRWIHVCPAPNSFIVKVDDSLQAWTNGRLHSPLHQVVLTGNKARYSIVTSVIPKAGYIIKAPEELVDEKHPLLFKPFDFSELMASFKFDAA